MNTTIPTRRKERKIPVLTLFWPVTDKIGTIKTYRLDGTGLHVLRVFPGCRVQG